MTRFFRHWPTAAALAFATLASVPGLAGAAGPAAALPQVPGACASPDLAALGSDDERHAAIRAYLLCLDDQTRTTESVSGALSRPAPGGADARSPGKGRELRLDSVGRPVDAAGEVAK